MKIAQAKKLYEACDGYGIKDVTTEEGRNGFKMIVDSISDLLGEPLELYNLGKEIKEQEIAEAERIKQEKLQKEQLEAIKELERKFDRQKYECVYRNGKSKYLGDLKSEERNLAKKYEAAAKEYEEAYEARSSASRLVNSFSPTRNYYKNDNALGVLANQIEEQKYNERKKEMAERSDRAWDALTSVVDSTYNKKWDIEKQLGRIKKQIEIIEPCIVDTSNADAKFAHLQIGAVEISKGLDRYVNGNFSVMLLESDFMVLNAPAFLDGSLKITIKNGKGEVAGEGYFAPSNKGFDSVSVATFVGELTGEYDENETYTGEVEPIEMWYADKKILEAFK